MVPTSFHDCSIAAKERLFREKKIKKDEFTRGPLVGTERGHHSGDSLIHRLFISRLRITPLLNETRRQDCNRRLRVIILHKKREGGRESGA
jgi:hypothetical protein